MRALVDVEDREPDADFAPRRTIQRAHPFAMPGRLNLDDVGAEIREQQRSIRAVVEVGEIEHPDVVERANWHEAPLGARRS